MARKKTFKKSSEQANVRRELSQDAPMILRIHRESCPACQMSEKPWQDFCKQGVPGFMLIEVEEQAMPPELMKSITGFPTYAVHNKHGKSKHHTGALMSLEDIRKFVNTGTD